MYKVKFMSQIAAKTIRKSIRDLKKKGWTPYIVYDGDEYEKVSNESEVMSVVDSVEYSTVYFRNGDEKGSVLYIPCNGEDAVSDHTVNLPL